MKAQVTFNYPRVESVPSKNWREQVAAGQPVSYSFSVSGQAEIVTEAGKTLTDAQFRITKISRTNTLNGLLDKAGWKYQPSRSESLAQAAIKSEVNAKGNSVESFDLDADGRIQFDEGAMTYEEALQGLPLLAFHVTGKSLRLIGADLEFKSVKKREGGTKEIAEISTCESAATIDTPVISGSMFADEAEADITGVISAAARKGKAEPATLTIKA